MGLNVAHDDIEPIAPAERTVGFKGMVLLWVAANLVIPTILTGQGLVPDLSPGRALAAVFFGSLVGCLALALMAVMGTRTGLPTLVVARGAYGHRGAKIPAAANALILLGWMMIQGYLGARSLNFVLQSLFHLDNVLLCIVVVEGLVIAVTILGHTGIQKIESFVSITMLIGALGVFYALFSNYSLQELQQVPLSPSPKVTYSIAFDLVLSTAFSWISLPCDYSRFCRTQTGSGAGIAIGYLLGTLIAMSAGIAVATFAMLRGMSSGLDPTAVLASFGFGVPASLVIVVSVIMTNVLALYSAVMSAMSIPRRKVRFVPLTLGIGLLSILGASLRERLMESFFEWILLVGALFIPVFTIVLVDYYLVSRASYAQSSLIRAIDSRYTYYKGVNSVAVVAYLCGVVFALYFTYVRPLAMGVTAATFVFTAVVYFTASKLAYQTGRQRVLQ
ncbi:MAG TPA: cytosine permease [Steroidobacteraceae bacterium]|nr:cytosine permease [Steroidobacteraceae bacterium]